MAAGLTERAACQPACWPPDGARRAGQSSPGREHRDLRARRRGRDAAWREPRCSKEPRSGPNRRPSAGWLAVRPSVRLSAPARELTVSQSAPLSPPHPPAVRVGGDSPRSVPIQPQVAAGGPGSQTLVCIIAPSHWPVQQQQQRQRSVHSADVVREDGRRLRARKPTSQPANQRGVASSACRALRPRIGRGRRRSFRSHRTSAPPTPRARGRDGSASGGRGCAAARTTPSLSPAPSAPPFSGSPRAAPLYIFASAESAGETPRPVPVPRPSPPVQQTRPPAPQETTRKHCPRCRYTPHPPSPRRCRPCSR